MKLESENPNSESAENEALNCRKRNWELETGNWELYLI